MDKLRFELSSLTSQLCAFPSATLTTCYLLPCLLLSLDCGPIVTFTQPPIISKNLSVPQCTSPSTKGYQSRKAFREQLAQEFSTGRCPRTSAGSGQAQQFHFHLFILLKKTDSKKGLPALKIL